ncbi:hypothetical protein GCM10010964_43720 [Caldovatus sediminis]|uniref:Uncharacterized protein n=1 Tax=Caldovatus sediminis TaxID=2041189 RepID=A0A8J3EF78_9PROT|nr:hypothetical protein [Caldovatus sediminis]GGG51787.1 hypothetical protein GCM10010964_43720 [Caldovatus sediminis]
MKAALLSLLRHALTYGAGWLAAKGWLDTGTAHEAASALVVLFAAIWSAVERRAAVAEAAQTRATEAGNAAVERDRAAGGAEQRLRDGTF